MKCYLAYTQFHIAVAYIEYSKICPEDQVTAPENATAGNKLMTLGAKSVSKKSQVKLTGTSSAARQTK